MIIQVIPAPESDTLWRLEVDGECFDEGTQEEMQEAADMLYICEENYIE